MRTIEEIKKSITEAWMKDKTLAAAYGFSEGSDWPFSKVSIENTLCYIVAAAIWTHERLFDAHQTEVETIIAQKKPHSLRWYVDKVKQFRAGVPLADDSDEYADGMTDDEIEASQVVKFAAANESSGTVYIKVATESNGTKSPLTAEQVNGLKEYIAEVKDAGVRVEVINQPACRLATATRHPLQPDGARRQRPKYQHWGQSCGGSHRSLHRQPAVQWRVPQ